MNWDINAVNNILLIIAITLIAVSGYITFFIIPKK